MTDHIFAILPIEAAQDHRLNASHYRVLIALLSFRNKDTNLCCPSRAAISERTGYTIQTVSKYTKQLEDLGWLEKSGKGGHGLTTRFKIRVPTVSNMDTVDDETTVSKVATVAKVETVSKLAKERYPSRRLNGIQVGHPKQTSNRQVTDNNTHAASNDADAASSDADFDAFWISYPRKVTKAKAKQLFQRLKSKEPAAIPKVIAHLATDPFRGTENQFIPHPTTYLNQRRWEDETPHPTKRGFSC